MSENQEVNVPESQSKGVPVEVILSILAVAAKYGIAAVEHLVREWKSDKPITIQDIQEFELKFKDPASYFEKR